MKEVEIIGIRLWHSCPDRRCLCEENRLCDAGSSMAILRNSLFGFPPAEASTPRYGEFRTQSSDVLAAAR
jgi:hypothetical protein